MAAAQAGARLISPFPGRVKDYVTRQTGQASDPKTPLACSEFAPLTPESTPSDNESTPLPLD